LVDIRPIVVYALGRQTTELLAYCKGIDHGNEKLLGIRRLGRSVLLGDDVRG